MQNAVSRQKRLIIVFVVANAQKQGVMGARLVLASRTTMFQELEQNAYTACGILPSEAMILSDSTESVIPAYISPSGKLCFKSWSRMRRNKEQ